MTLSTRMRMASTKVDYLSGKIRPAATKPFQSLMELFGSTPVLDVGGVGAGFESLKDSPPELLVKMSPSTLDGR